MGFQQGLSGLNAASKNLDVIGHNIANANTTGFKSSRAEFAEAVASAVGSASGQNSGIGVNVAAVTQQFRQGPITTTGNNLDVAINGNGFFVVRQPDGSTAYTRAGNFGLDKQGNLKTVQGDNVMGYPVDATTGKVLAGGQPVPMVFPSGQPIAAKTTTKIDVSLNLDARATPAAGNSTATPPVPATPRATYGTSINVYDSQGVPTAVPLYFEKEATPANTWKVYTSLDTNAAAVGSLTFDASGKLTGNSTITGVQINSSNPNAPTPGTINGTAGVTLDFSNLSQFGSKFAVSSLKQDGYTSGALTGINVGNDGSIVATYSNGVTRTEGQLALAAFTNTQGLGAVGDNKWVETSDSGPALNGTAESGTFGSLRSGALEDSNVDLTAELVNMMTAQRAYQANAQTIKTQDQVFSTLVNLR
ncbi:MULTISPECIES: flagellar hook protein FlgE [Delftia]|nr:MULTISPECIES: flagellar hook protein FlgE [Delftia]MBK0115513.1 flagellar hook protein FlgE [Delftia sp. S65]MBK0121273.1 flagellar hook protein FlgE [Delftia sp. S67]MBK0132892.1 flagellar hook protein FlgE [Delftia sp. S66]